MPSQSIPKFSDSLIKNGISTPRKKLAILFGENEVEYKIAQKKYGYYGGDQEYEPIPVCLAKNGNKYKIPLNLMFKPDIQEFGMAIGKPKHSFIQKIINNTESFRDFYVGNVDFEVSKIPEENFHTNFHAYYDCKEEKMVLN